ncbi:MAG: hypothetical protein ABIH21_00300 [Patescibacteria group bacterium]
MPKTKTMVKTSTATKVLLAVALVFAFAAVAISANTASRKPDLVIKSFTFTQLKSGSVGYYIVVQNAGKASAMPNYLGLVALDGQNKIVPLTPDAISSYKYEQIQYGQGIGFRIPSTAKYIRRGERLYIRGIIPSSLISEKGIARMYLKADVTNVIKESNERNNFSIGYLPWFAYRPVVAMSQPPIGGEILPGVGQPVMGVAVTAKNANVYMNTFSFKPRWTDTSLSGWNSCAQMSDINKWMLVDNETGVNLITKSNVECDESTGELQRISFLAPSVVEAKHTNKYILKVDLTSIINAESEEVVQFELDRVFFSNSPLHTPIFMPVYAIGPTFHYSGVPAPAFDVEVIDITDDGGSAYPRFRVDVSEPVSKIIATIWDPGEDGMYSEAFDQTDVDTGGSSALSWQINFGRHNKMRPQTEYRYSVLAFDLDSNQVVASGMFTSESYISTALDAGYHSGASVPGDEEVLRFQIHTDESDDVDIKQMYFSVDHSYSIDGETKQWMQCAQLKSSDWVLWNLDDPAENIINDVSVDCTEDGFVTGALVDIKEEIAQGVTERYALFTNTSQASTIAMYDPVIRVVLQKVMWSSLSFDEDFTMHDEHNLPLTGGVIIY